MKVPRERERERSGGPHAPRATLLSYHLLNLRSKEANPLLYELLECRSSHRTPMASTCQRHPDRASLDRQQFDVATVRLESRSHLFERSNHAVFEGAVP